MCAWALSLSAQKKPAQQAEAIKNDTTYLYGEGRGATDSDADQNALANLISKISVDVVSNFDMEHLEVKQNAQLESKEKVEMIVKTYSSASLTNTQSLFVKHEPNAYVLRYVKNSEVRKIFKEREDRVVEYVRNAQSATENVRLDDALRYYYWALCLLKTLPQPTKLKLQGHTLANWIPDQMNDIFKGIEVKVANKDGNEIDLYATYKGNPVTSLEFRFMDGLNYSSPRSVKDGLAQIEFRPGVDMDNIQLRYEYEFAGQDKEVTAVTQAIRGTAFPKATAFVGAGKKKQQQQVQAQVQQQVKASSEAISSLELDMAKDYLRVMGEVVKAIQTKSYDKAKGYFTTNGYQMFEQLIRYGNASVIGTPQYTFYSLPDGVVCRSVPMQFAFKNNHRTFCEDVTFTFDAQQKIDCVAFALDQVARRDIFTVGDWPDSTRMVIATFLENYKTAFALKRLDYIESIFSDDALIITGHVVKRAPKTMENEKYLSNEYVKYTRQDKRQYLRNLERCFRSNEFINLRFTDNEVLKLAKEHGESYGILIHQDYYSSSYSDTGYLCLLVDFNNPQKPTIVLRTWQPQRDATISPNLARDSKYWGLLTPYKF